MDLFHNPFTKFVHHLQHGTPKWMGKAGADIARVVIPAAFLYAGGAAVAGAGGGAGAAGAGTVGAGEGVGLGTGVDASTGLFAGESANAGASTYGTTGGGPTGMPLPGGTESVTNALMRQRMPGMSQPYRYQQPQRNQPNFVFPSPIVSVMPKDTYGSY